MNRCLIRQLVLIAMVAVITRSALGAPDTPSPRTDANSQLAHEQLMKKARQGKIDVYFLGDSITRRWGATDYPEFLAHWNQSFSVGTPPISAGVAIRRNISCGDQLADKDGKLFEGMTVDKLHLSLKGYEVWAKNLKPLLTELLGPPAALDSAPPATGDPKAATKNTAPDS